MSDTVERTRGWTFGMVDKTVMRDETIPRNVKLVYAYLTTYCSDQRSAHPGRARMARELGLSLSALDEAKKIGQDIGLWRIESRPDPDNPKRNATNRYWLNDQDGSYVPGSGTGARVKGKPRGRAAAKQAESSPEPEPEPASPEQGVGQNLGHPLGQNLGDPGPKSGREEDQPTRPGNNETESSPPARPHADARGRESAAKPMTPRQQRRAWEYDGASPSWLNLDNPYLVDDITNYVDSKWGCEPGTRQQVEGMAWRVRGDGRPVAARNILNTALRDTRWIDDDEAPDPRVCVSAPFTPVAEMPAADRAMYEPAWFDGEGPDWCGPVGDAAAG